MKRIGEQQLIRDELLDDDELCPLCFEPLNNGKSHGSFCK